MCAFTHLYYTSLILPEPEKPVGRVSVMWSKEYNTSCHFEIDFY